MGEYDGRNRIDVLGILSLFIGIIGFLFTIFLTGGVMVGAICAVLAIIFATLSIRRFGKTKIARAGRILGIIGVLLIVFYFILLFITLTRGI